MSSTAKPAANPAGAAAGSVTVVTQTRVLPDKDADFMAWQETISAAVGACAGFLDRKIIPPSPPAQVDWVILQRFSSMEAARQWLRSEQRLALLKTAQPLLVGHDDVHIIADGDSGVLPAPVSAVISTRIKPGKEGAYHEWERRIAAAQARAPGFQGYRSEPPVPGVQESWLAIVRFDSEANLDLWMKSPARLALLAEGELLSDEVHARIVRSGFDQWFGAGGAAGASGPPPWKQNMLVLLQLYPVVFLFGLLVQGPVLMKALHMPFWLALFIGNVISVILLNWLVPWTGTRFEWWLRPRTPANPRVDWLGGGLIVALYALSLLVFALLS